MQKSRFLREERHIDVDLRRFRLADQRWTPGDLLAAPNCRVSRLRPLSRQEFRRRSAGRPNPIRSPDMPLGRGQPPSPLAGHFPVQLLGEGRSLPPVSLALPTTWRRSNMRVIQASLPTRPDAKCLIESGIRACSGFSGAEATGRTLCPPSGGGPSGSLLHPDPRKAAVSARRPLAPRTARAERSPATIRLRRSDRPRGRLLHQRA